MSTNYIIHGLSVEPLLCTDINYIVKGEHTFLNSFSPFGYYDSVNDIEIYGQETASILNLQTKQELLDFLDDKPEYYLYFLNKNRCTYTEKKIIKYIPSFKWTRISINTIQ